MSLEHLISSYGYFALLLGTFFEGETVLIIAGFLAHRGYLQLPWVIVVAFIGNFSWDQLFYFIGRTRGMQMFEKRPGWRAKSKKSLTLLRNHEFLFILGFPFIYGGRTLAPFAIGLSGTSPGRFLSLNSIGVLAWSTVVGTLGYLVGNTLELMLGKIGKYEVRVVAAIALVSLAVGIIKWIVANRRVTTKHETG